MKTTLIVLVCLAVVLGIIAYFAVFSGTQVIEPIATSTSTGQQSSTPTMILTAPSSSANALTSTTPVTGPKFTANFSAPYPVVWQEGETQLAVTGASLAGNQLSLAVNLQLGADAQCVPINLRVVTDEAGDMAAPSVPTSANFQLGSGTSCAGAANGIYPGQIVTFTVDPTAAPFLITTGAPANTFFEIATTTGNGLQVAIPQQSG